MRNEGLRIDTGVPRQVLDPFEQADGCCFLDVGITIDVEALGFFPHFIQSEGGNKHDLRTRPEFRILFYMTCRLKTVHPVHFPVHENNIIRSA